MENMEPVKEEKTPKQIDAAKRFKKFYDAKLKGQNVKKECECGCKISYMGMSNHKKTKKHAKLMLELKSNPNV